MDDLIGRIGRMGPTWSAPGRVNLIGEHIDYNGGRVLPFALHLRTTATVERRPDCRVVVTSAGLGTAELAGITACATATRCRAGQRRYVAGALWVFAEAVEPVGSGLDIRITSTLPVGAGLSSSAAVECAVLCALDELAGSGLTRQQVAALALRGERESIGVPCGPMDQLTAMLAVPAYALLIDTRTLESVPVPLELEQAGLTLLLVIDTRVRHALTDGGYADRQAACATGRCRDRLWKPRLPTRRCRR